MSTIRTPEQRALEYKKAKARTRVRKHIYLLVKEIVVEELTILQRDVGVANQAHLALELCGAAYRGVVDATQEVGRENGS